MNIPHEVEELILAFVGLKRKKRCIAQTKSNKICSRRTGNWILFVNLCMVIHRAMQNSNAYRRRKELRKRTKGKTYHPNAHINHIILR